MSDHQINLPDKLIYSQEVIEFVTVANEFCLLLEGLNNVTREEFVKQTYKMLSLLHLKAIIIPKPKNIKNAETESFINEADWHFIDNGISTKLGSYEVFTDMHEPATPEVSINISLSEALADIYQDLKDFTQLYHFGNEESITAGLWECKNNFEQIWGPRLIIVLKEFHNLLFGNLDLTDAEEESQEKVEDFTSNPKKWIDNMFGD